MLILGNQPGPSPFGLPFAPSSASRQPLAGFRMQLRKSRRSIRQGAFPIRTSIFLMLLIRLIGPMVFCSGADALTVSWADLQNVVAKRPVAVEIQRSQELRGTLLSQDDTGILLAVVGSKPGGLHAKYANVRVERKQITRLRVVKDPLRTRYRWIGGIAGYFAGGALAIAAGGGEQDPRLLVGLIGGAVLGYHTGKSLDKGMLELVLLDGSSPAGALEGSPAAGGLPVYLLPTPEFPIPAR